MTLTTMHTNFKFRMYFLFNDNSKLKFFSAFVIIVPFRKPRFTLNNWQLVNQY